MVMTYVTYLLKICIHTKFQDPTLNGAECKSHLGISHNQIYIASNIHFDYGSWGGRDGEGNVCCLVVDVYLQKQENMENVSGYNVQAWI
jgi:hypothetical protein